MEISTVQAFNSYSSRLDVCQCLVVQTPTDNMSKNMPSSFISHVACEYELWSVVRSSIYLRNWVAIKHALCIIPRLLTHLVQKSKVGTVDVRVIPIQRKQEIALKELLQFVRCHCKTRCVTKHSSCRKM